MSETILMDVFTPKLSQIQVTLVLLQILQLVLALQLHFHTSSKK